MYEIQNILMAWRFLLEQRLSVVLIIIFVKFAQNLIWLNI